MGKGKNRWQRRNNPPPPPRRPAILLEQTSASHIKETKAHVSALLRWYWDFHSELAYQRKLIKGQLHGVLTRGAVAFSFAKWQRVVKYKYGLHPLSSVGSLSDPGGRFNIGDIDQTHFPRFSALYLAVDKATAIQEAHGQGQLLTPGLEQLEMALAIPQSEVFVSVSGQLESVVDLRSPQVLQPFIELVRDFQVSGILKKQAQSLGHSINLARTVGELLPALLAPEWRYWPGHFDVPATPQVFGQTAFNAGVNGILFPSKYTGRDCLAIFPRNLANSGSWVQLDDQAPHPKVPTRIDSSSWNLCEQTADEVIG